MTIYDRGEWHYDLDISPWEGKFVWHVVRLKIDRKRPTQVVLGSWVAGGIAATQQEAEHEGMAAIDRDSKH